MYKDFFGLSDYPFTIAPNPRYLYMSAQHHEALAHLIYGISGSGGFIVLTGEVGTGKTTVCRCFLEQIPKTIDVAFIVNPKLTVRELLGSICDELGIVRQANRQPVAVNGHDSATPATVMSPDAAQECGNKEYIDLINDHLLTAHAQGRRVLLIIDEAQNLSTQVLEQLRLLTNLETNDTKLLQIVLLGQPELNELFQRKELRQLAQRITARYHLTALSLRATKRYLHHRLSVAGSDTQLFDSKVIHRLHIITKGIPRLINVICDRALLGAYVNGQRKVTLNTLNSAAEEVLGKQPAILMKERLIEWVSYRRGLAWSVVAICIGLPLGLAVYAISGVELPWSSKSSMVTVTESEAVDTMTDVSVTEKLPSASSKLVPTARDHGDVLAGSGVKESKEEPSTKALLHEIESLRATVHELQQKGKVVEQTELEKKQNRVQSTQGASETEAVGLTPQQTLNLAAQQLLTLWGESSNFQLDSLESLNKQLCQSLTRAELGCLYREGAFSSLQTMDRPALVALKFDQSGLMSYGTIAKIKDETAYIQIGNRAMRMPLDELNAIWGGQFWLLWKKPPVYHGPVVEGTVGREVRWLGEKLGEILDDQRLRQGVSLFDDAFRASVEKFQRSEGLTVDGVVGARTFIAINSALGVAVPRLSTTNHLDEQGR